MMQMMSCMMNGWGYGGYGNNMCGYNMGGYGANGGMCAGKGCSKGSKGGKGKGPWFDPEEFLRLNLVDPSAADSFRQLDQQTQQMIIRAGSLKSGRDPTAILISRITKVRHGQPLPEVMSNPGDWFCYGCGDLQFAKNERCKSCGGEKPMPESIKDLPVQDVEKFLQESQIQEHAADSFRKLAPGTQQLIIAAGSLGEARDPTAVLITRMSKARMGTLEPKKSMPGDWDCPGCGDLNFARNMVCRKCGSPKFGNAPPLNAPPLA